ncbi:nucleoid-associated protein, YbaB/EbfC family [Patescibacteria group bacterium]|nr:MAG: nucleoid-associated protein, YbaB/EbfC family [Patescibacteria group bacterium]
MFNKLKHIKDLKKQGKIMQNELATVVQEGSSAWGKVKLTVNGNRDLISVAIDETMLTDKTKLEEAIKEAWKDATGMKFQMKLAKKMQDMGGMDMLKNFGGGGE